MFNYVNFEKTPWKTYTYLPRFRLGTRNVIITTTLLLLMLLLLFILLSFSVVKLYGQNRSVPWVSGKYLLIHRTTLTRCSLLNKYNSTLKKYVFGIICDVGSKFNKLFLETFLLHNLKSLQINKFNHHQSF